MIIFFLTIILSIFISQFISPASLNEIIIISNGSYINANFIPKPDVTIDNNDNIIKLSWNVSLSNCDNMFSNTDIEEIDLYGFDTSEITSMECMFNNCTKLTKFNLTNKEFSKLSTINKILTNCPSLSHIHFENINFTELISMNNLFNIFSNNTVINFIYINFPKLETIENLMRDYFYDKTKYFNISFENINIENVITMDKMFLNFTNLENVNFININATNLYSMNDMFNGCSQLSQVIFDNFNAPNLSEIERMFYESGIVYIKLGGILENVNISKLKSMKSMLQRINTYINFHLENIFFPELISMEEMFKQSYFTNITFNNFKAPNLANISHMFERTTIKGSLNLDGILENINVSKIITMEEMFRATNFQNPKNFVLESINFLELESMERMFYNCLTINNFNFINLNFTKSVLMTDLLYRESNYTINKVKLKI